MAEAALDLDQFDLDPRTWEEWFEELSDEERELVSIDLKDNAPVAPQPGPQTLAFNSEADVVGFGGAAGGGKTSLAAIMSMIAHHRTVAFRFDKAQLSGMMDILVEYVGNDIGLNRQAGVFRFGDYAGHLIEFGGVGGPDEHKKWQGREHDLIVVDEATEVPRWKFEWLKAWNRTARPDQRCRILLTFNPPDSEEGRWVIDYFAPWLDERHPNPAEPGEIRYFVTNEDGEEIEVADGTPYKIERVDNSDLVRGPKTISYEVRPESRTFYPARAFDNKFVSDQYISTLNSLKEPHRSRMMMGDFRSGIVDKPYQVIPAAWVDEANERWRKHIGDNPLYQWGMMHGLGIDVAKGGKANTVWAPRFGLAWPKLVIKPGIETKRGEDVGAPALSMMLHAGAPTVGIDANGVGSSAFDYLNKHYPKVVDCFMQGGPGDLQTLENTSKFLNLRAALYWILRKLLDPDRGLPIMLPPDNALRSELIVFTYNLRGGKMVMQDKKEIEDLLGYSPDRADAVAMSIRTIATEDWADYLRPHDPYVVNNQVLEPERIVRGDWMAV